MTTATKKRPAAHRPPPKKGRRARRRSNVMWIVGSAAAALAIVAVVVTSGGSRTETVAQTAGVSIEGAPLPDFPRSGGADPARGMTIPSVRGTDFAGNPLEIRSEPLQIIIFLAHWCSHCQAEVPRIQRWIDDTGMPKEHRLISVSTAVDEARGNYPPQAWLERERWSVPVIRDDESSSIGRAFGVTSYPAFVVVGAGGRVFERRSGELPIETIEAWIRGVS